MTSKAIRSNWKQEPLVWMIIAIPFSAVIMGVFMITLAIRSDTGLVIDDYYKHGKEINRVLFRDQKAYQLGLAGRVEISAQGAITIQLDSEQALADYWPLEFKMIHATRPGLDQFFVIENPASMKQLRTLKPVSNGKLNLIAIN